jgi:glyoxylase-like metal-dependent hydrolase (beta-lactamase superfamily II)
MIQGLTRPSVLYIDGVNLYLGEREIQVRFFPGHTGGDSVVFVPDAGVALAGDLLWRNTVPNIVDGTIPAWIATLDTLAKTNAQYTFIPGHGDVANARDVIAFPNTCPSGRADGQETRRVRSEQTSARRHGCSRNMRELAQSVAR